MNNIDYNNLNLRDKTFLNFTDDPAIIREIIGDEGTPMREMSDAGRVITYMEFADLTNDPKLAEAIRKEFANDFELIFNE